MFVSRSPGFVSAPHGGVRVPLPSLVDHGVHELEDVRRAKLQRGSGSQHSGLCDALAVHEGVGVVAVRRHRHHAFAVHQVAVVRQDPRAEQLQKCTRVKNRSSEVDLI